MKKIIGYTIVGIIILGGIWAYVWPVVKYGWYGVIAEVLLFCFIYSIVKLLTWCFNEN